MSLSKKSIGGSIHRIREFELEKVNLGDEFDILQIVGEGWFGKILLTDHRSTQTEMVLKALPKAYTGLSDFFREFHYGLHLSAHRNIITTYDVTFETASFYVFSQEYAPLGDLTSNVTETGLGELHAKRVARQLAAAVHHIHSRELVHRDIKLDNILVFRSDFSRIKLCDFGETRRVNTVVRRHNEWLPYTAPEVLLVDTDATYKTATAHDVWQFGIVLFVCLTGCLPWQKAAGDDPRYARYRNWHTATLNIAKKPKLFQLISSRAQRMFKRLLEPKAEKRPITVLEVNKYLEDRWLAKLGAEKALNGGADERDELCPSMYSFHSSLEEKNQLLYTLTRYGIETTVDRLKKKDRIREWIQASAIAEEDEDEPVSDLLEEFNEADDEEPITMKGRHFPEVRAEIAEEDSGSGNGRRGSDVSIKRKKPSSTSEERNHSTGGGGGGGSSGKRRSNNQQQQQERKSRASRSSANRKIERKVPFAPQVAGERKAVAKFANFPNGDPSLGFVSKDNEPSCVDNNKADDYLVGANQPEKLIEPLTVSTYRIRPDERIVTSSIMLNSSGNSPNTSHDSSTMASNCTPGSSTEITADIGLTGFSDEQALRVEELSDKLDKMTPQAPARKHRSQTAPFPATTTSEEVKVEDSRKTQSVLALARDSSMEKSSVLVDNNSSACEIPIPAMSAGSHLAFHSFNALKATVSPIHLLNERNKTTRVQQDAKETMIYGKDAYEHYGIAQGPVVNSGKRGSSSRSGSRSVSN